MAEVTGLRNNALPYPVYGAPWGVVFPMLDADGDLVTGATTPDAERSLNGDTFADCTNESTEIATNSGMYYLLLTAAEMTADVVSVIAKSATAGMKTTAMVLYPAKLVTLRAGTVGANAGDGTTLQLDSSAVAVDDYYNGCLLVGTLDSVVEARVISDYAGSTKVCTVSPAFVTTPDNNDTFVVYQPSGRQMLQADPVAWNGTAVSTPATAGIPDVNVKNIDNDAASASGTVTFPNATLASTTNITAGTITTVTTTTTATNVTTVNGLAAGVITATSIAADAIAATKIATGAITSAKFAAGAIDAAAIANNAIDAATFAADVDAEFLSYIVDDATRIDASALNTASVTTIPAIDAKTTNLPSDPADASVIAARFDTLDTSVGDLPTNAELATALGTADDAVLTAIDNLPTNAELATALGTADDAVLAQIALVKTQTDKLTFTVANEVNANTRYIKGQEIDGAGTSGDPWGPV